MADTPIELVGLDHVVLRVSDVASSLRFYCDVLGCRVERSIEELGLHQLRAGEQLIDLVDLAKPLGRAGGNAPAEGGRNMDHFAVRLADFDESALCTYLREHGVEPGDVSPRYGAKGTGPSMYVRDPDGNIVELKGPPTP